MLEIREFIIESYSICTGKEGRPSSSLLAVPPKFQPLVHQLELYEQKGLSTKQEHHGTRIPPPPWNLATTSPMRSGDGVPTKWNTCSIGVNQSKNSVSLWLPWNYGISRRNWLTHLLGIGSQWWPAKWIGWSRNSSTHSPSYSSVP